MSHSNNRLQSFTESWDKDITEIHFKDLKGDFYPNEKGLVVLRDLLEKDNGVKRIVVDGGFEKSENPDDIFYAFAYLEWNEMKWNLTDFQCASSTTN